jgi:hypothetical protein
MCDDGGSRSCDIHCPACKKYENSTEYSKENMRKSSANVHSSWKVMLTIATFISLARSLLIISANHGNTYGKYKNKYLLINEQ